MGNTACCADSRPKIQNVLAQPILPGSIVAFGARGIYRVDLQNGSVKKVVGGAWGSIRSSVRDPDQDKLFAFGPIGVYCVAKDGTYAKHHSGTWASMDQNLNRQQTACYIGNGKAVYIGTGAIYSMNLRDQTYEELATDNWAGVKAAVYDPHGGYTYAIGNMGVYKVNTSNGTHETISSGSWGFVDTAVLVDKESILCFGATGVYRLNLRDGSDKKVASGAWEGMQIGLKDPESDGVIVFGNLGIYRVNPDGTYKKLLGGHWGTCQAAIYDPTPRRKVAAPDGFQVAEPALIRRRTTIKDASSHRASIAAAIAAAGLSDDQLMQVSVDDEKETAINDTGKDAAPDAVETK